MWLPRAVDPHADRRVDGLRASSPVFSSSAPARVGSYVELIRWWTSLQLLVQNQVAGTARVRRAAQKDVTAGQLAHTLTQARLAAAAAYLGAHVVLEPPKAGGPGDVILRFGDAELFVEVATFGPDTVGAQEDHYFDQHVHQLIAQVGRREMYWEGRVPGFLNSTDEIKWRQRVADAADQCAQAQESVEVRGPWGCLVVRPGTAPRRARLVGPHVETNTGTRLVEILNKKAAKTRAAGIAWIWIEDTGGTHISSEFNAMSLVAKLNALARLTEPVLLEHPHLAGLVWSRQETTSATAPNVQTQDRSGIALQRSLPTNRVRQTVILNRRLILPEQTRLLATLCDREPLWLDWALEQLGVPGRLTSLLKNQQYVQALT